MNALSILKLASLGVFLGTAAASMGCDEKTRLPGAPAPTGSEWVNRSAPLGDAGSYVDDGDACDEEGAQLECGKVVEQHDDYLTCSMGYRTCTAGVWSACIGERMTQLPVPDSASAALRPLALGSAGACPAGLDPCDPYCHQIVDTPGNFTAGTNLSNTSLGVTPLPTGIGNCTSLTLSPSTSTLNVTALSPLTVSGNPVTFTLTAEPSGCADPTFVTTWSVDKLDRATMSGSTPVNTGGRLTLAVPIAGTLKVTAFAHGLNVSTNIAVKVNVVDAPVTAGAAAALSSPANGITSAGNIALFSSGGVPLAGTSATTAHWLYPYGTTAGTCATCPPTYFPLGLPAPVVQYAYTAGLGKAVKLSLRYPVNSTASAALFNYSIIVKESNVVSQTAGIAANQLDPQIVIPQAAWEYFEQTARGADADLVLQRLQSTLEVETRRTVHFVNGQLKGTVYYNSYTSPQGGNTGAVLSIAPGATSPTLAVQPSGKCTVCHSMNLDGSKLIANGGRSTNSYQFNQSRRYDLTTVPTPASPQVLNDYNDAVVGDFTPGDYDAQGDRYTFGASWLDGSLYMTHGGEPLYGGDRNWRAPNDYSKFYRPSSGTLVTPSNWANISGVTPRFSVDGRRLAFGYWGASGSTLPCSTNAIAPCTTSGARTLSPVAGGTRLVVVDFASPTTPSSASGWGVSNARDVTPGISQKVAWPAFTPDGNSVLYQRQYRTSRSAANGGVLSGGWSPSDINTVAGALAEIWMSNVPADGSTAATPTRLSALNGLNSGTSYLPEVPRTTYPVNRFDTSQTVTSGSAGPAVTLTGTASDSPLDVRIDPVTSGARGTATFRYSIDGGGTWSSTLTTQATVVLGTTGLTAAFASGSNYNKNSTYKALVGQVEITGTPAAAGYDVRIGIYSTTGPRGTARFRYSTNGGTSWSSTLTTAASVPLGSTGLTATFGNVTYESTAWTYGATVDGYPAYHGDNASFAITAADSCSNTGTASSVYDYRLNYLPAVAPTEAGGYTWVVFTSRRMYGNIATDDPWDAEPGFACNSGEPPTKKLWMAAVDKNWTPGTDPSHPAFYMPGQELVAGNSNGYWVNVQCSALNSTCTTDEDCCGGTGTDQTAKCSVVSTATVPPTRKCQSYSSCSAVGEDCSTGADCCTGLVCPTDGGECVSLPSPVYEVQNLEREYTASCPYGTSAAWRFFEWQATIPTGSSIDFSVQTKQLVTDTYQPTIALAMATATTSTPAGNWERGPSTAGSVLSAASVTPGNYLRVTMTFNPNATGSAAPTLLNWRQVFDCLPNQ